MKWIFRQIQAFLSVYYAYALEYKAEVFLWALSGSLPLILMGVWIEASKGGNFGLNSAQFAQYFLSVFLVKESTIVWMIWEFEKEVLEGTLSFHLLQPIDPVWHHVGKHVAERIARIPFLIALVSLFFFIYPEAFWIPNFINILIFILVIILTFTLRFIIQYTFALLAFWTERVAALEELWFLMYLFCAGVIAPLDVYPPIVRDILLWTPFPYLIHFPASILIGLDVNLTRGFLMMLGWGFIFFIINRWLWKKGLKKYSGMGA